MHVLLVIVSQSQSFGPGTSQPGINEGVLDTASSFFQATFIASIISAAFGMTKLLKVGPCAIVPRNKYGLGFFLSFLSILFGLLGKGFLFGLMVPSIVPSETDPVGKLVGIGICLGTCYLPPMIYVSTKNSELIKKNNLSKYLPFLVHYSVFDTF